MKYFYILFLLLISIITGCSGSGSRDAKLLDEYRSFIIKLPKNDFYSVTRAKEYFDKNLNGAKQDYRDSAFIEFRNLYYNVINSSSENFWNNQEFINKLRTSREAPDVVKFLKDIDNNGIRLSTTEGDYYLDEKTDFLYNNFHTTVSASLSDYLKIRMHELEEGFSEDAMLIIPFRTVGERIRIWEEYIMKYPTSLLLADAKYSYHLYLNTFITGLDNTPISIDQKLKPEIKAEYEYFINHNKGTQSATVVNDYYQLLSSKGFTLTQDLEQFYKDYSIEPMQGVQPPTR